MAFTCHIYILHSYKHSLSTWYNRQILWPGAKKFVHPGLESNCLFNSIINSSVFMFNKKSCYILSFSFAISTSSRFILFMYFIISLSHIQHFELHSHRWKVFLTYYSFYIVKLNLEAVLAIILTDSCVCACVHVRVCMYVCRFTRRVYCPVCDWSSLYVYTIFFLLQRENKIHFVDTCLWNSTWKHEADELAPAQTGTCDPVTHSHPKMWWDLCVAQECDGKLQRCGSSPQQLNMITTDIYTPVYETFTNSNKTWINLCLIVLCFIVWARNVQHVAQSALNKCVCMGECKVHWVVDTRKMLF